MYACLYIVCPYFTVMQCLSVHVSTLYVRVRVCIVYVCVLCTCVCIVCTRIYFQKCDYGLCIHTVRGENPRFQFRRLDWNQSGVRQDVVSLTACFAWAVEARVGYNFIWCQQIVDRMLVASHKFSFQTILNSAFMLQHYTLSCGGVTSCNVGSPCTGFRITVEMPCIGLRILCLDCWWLQDVLTRLRLMRSSKRKFDILKDLTGSIQPVSMLCNMLVTA